MTKQTLARYEKALEYLRLAHEEVSVIQAEALGARQYSEAESAKYVAKQILEVITVDSGEAGLAALVDYWKGAPR